MKNGCLKLILVLFQLYPVGQLYIVYIFAASRIHKSNRPSQYGSTRHYRYPIIITTYHADGLFNRPKLNCKIAATNRNNKEYMKYVLNKEPN